MAAKSESVGDKVQSEILSKDLFSATSKIAHERKVNEQRNLPVLRWAKGEKPNENE